MLFQFDVDDIAYGDTFAVLSQGRRRLLLKHLLPGEMQTLARLSRQKLVAREHMSEKIFASLRAHGLLLDTPRAAPLRKRISQALRIPSTAVKRMARPLLPLFSAPGLALIVLAQILLYCFADAHFARIKDFAHWITQVSPQDAAITMAVILASMIVHEFGHATACLKMTGATGSIRVIGFRGTPAMAADVSSICLTDERGKAMVAVAGALFQSSFGVCMLAFGPEAVRMGATMAVLGAMFSLTPLPNTDGYWLIRDFFNLRLAPRLWPARVDRAWTDVLYGYALIAATCGFTFVLSSQCLYLFRIISGGTTYITLKNAAIGTLFAYLTAITCIFIWKNARMFSTRITQQ